MCLKFKRILWFYLNRFKDGDVDKTFPFLWRKVETEQEKIHFTEIRDLL